MLFGPGTPLRSKASEGLGEGFKSEFGFYVHVPVGVQVLDGPPVVKSHQEFLGLVVGVGDSHVSLAWNLHVGLVFGDRVPDLVLSVGMAREELRGDRSLRVRVLLQYLQTWAW